MVVLNRFYCSIVFLYRKIVFILANSENLDKMKHLVFVKVPQVKKGLHVHLYEKTCLLGLPLGKAQTSLLSYRGKQEY